MKSEVQTKSKGKAKSTARIGSPEKLEFGFALNKY